MYRSKKTICYLKYLNFLVLSSSLFISCKTVENNDLSASIPEGCSIILDERIRHEISEFNKDSFIQGQEDSIEITDGLKNHHDIQLSENEIKSKLKGLFNSHSERIGRIGQIIGHAINVEVLAEAIYQDLSRNNFNIHHATHLETTKSIFGIAGAEATAEQAAIAGAIFGPATSFFSGLIGGIVGWEIGESIEVGLANSLESILEKGHQKPYFPKGEYLSSCTGVSLNAKVLSAKCHGHNVSIDLSSKKCLTSNGIRFDDGKLVCYDNAVPWPIKSVRSPPKVKLNPKQISKKYFDCHEDYYYDSVLIPGNKLGDKWEKIRVHHGPEESLLFVKSKIENSYFQAECFSPRKRPMRWFDYLVTLGFLNTKPLSKALGTSLDYNGKFVTVVGRIKYRNCFQRGIGFCNNVELIFYDSEDTQQFCQQERNLNPDRHYICPSDYQ